MRSRRLATPLFAALLAVGCAAPGSYPSLEPREIERRLAAEDEADPAPAPADDASLPGRLGAFVERARAGQSQFEAALAEARPAVAAAGAPESDAWVEAQQALSRLEAARAVTTGALADLDAFAVAEARSRTVSPADLERIQDAVTAVQALADRQSDEIGRLQASLRPI